MQRGEVWFAKTPGGDRPVLVLTRDPVADRIGSVVVAALTRTQRGLVSELKLSPEADGVPTECVVNFDYIHTLPRAAFRRPITQLSRASRRVMPRPSERNRLLAASSKTQALSSTLSNYRTRSRRARPLLPRPSVGPPESHVGAAGKMRPVVTGNLGGQSVRVKRPSTDRASALRCLPLGHELAGSNSAQTPTQIRVRLSRLP